MKLSLLFGHLVAVWRWIVLAKVACCCILVIVAALALGLYTWHSEDSIRFAGYALQILGMVFTIHGLLCIRVHFKQPPLQQLFFDWLKKFPRWKIKVASGSASISGVGLIDVANGEAWTPDNPNWSVEKRIEGIVKNLDRIRTAQGKHGKSIEELRSSHEAHKKKVAEETKAEKEKLQTYLKSLHTSNLMESLIGLVWLTVGLTMSTMAPELFIWINF